MKMFDPREKCPKCGSMIEKYKFTHLTVQTKGCLKLHCTYCGYKFKRATKDSEEK